MPSLLDYIDDIRGRLKADRRERVSDVTLAAYAAGLDAILDEIKNRAKADSRDGYIGDLWRTDYIVEGRGAFPLDMLRYACSWPADEGYANRIEDTHQPGYDRLTVIKLTRHHRDRVPELAEARWKSMGWIIKSHSTTRL